MNRPAAAEGLNDGQCAALDLSRDMIVSAGAGAGKTRVLGLRVIALIESGVPIDEIVAFTFTDKAASEMRQRVQQFLLARAAELDPKKDAAVLARVKRAQAEFNRNRISTVHSFCYRLLSDYAWEAELEPRAPILDERRQAQARDEAIRAVLLRADLDKDPELGRVLERIGAVINFSNLRATLNELLRKREQYRPGLELAAQRWTNADAELEQRRKLHDQLLKEAIKPVRDALNAFDLTALSAIAAKDTLRKRVTDVQDALQGPNVQDLLTALLTKEGNPRGFTAGAAANWKHHPELREDALNALQSAAVKAAEIKSRCPVVLDEHFERRVGAMLGDLHALFTRTLAAYHEACAGGLDFTALEQRSINLLETNPEVREEMVRRVRYLLVDEYQDTNPVQEKLFALLRDGDLTPGRFFAVGDAKQSIYGFRGSDVSIFNRALHEIPRRNKTSGADQAPLNPPWGLKCKKGKYTKERESGFVRLQHNYRTVKPVLELGNAIFKTIFSVPEPREYDAEAQDMIAGSDEEPTVDQPVELVMIHAKPQQRAESSDEVQERRKDDEAEWIANRVRCLHDVEGIPYSDIAMLVRRGTNNARYRQAFARHGLPLLVIGETGLFGSQEALDCVNLLRALSNPADDIAVLGLLRSPFAGLSDRYLTELAFRHNRHKGLLQRLRDDQEGHPHPTAAEFLARFDSLHARAGREAPALLLTEALTATGYALAVGCGFDAEQRLANLERVIEVVRATQAETPSLALLVRDLVNRIDAGEDETKGQPEQGADGVRLMTIHKSKGLEFPVVIIPDLGNRPKGGNTGLLRALPRADDEPLGLWLQHTDEERLGEWGCDLYGQVAQWHAAERGVAEERRALYVGFTRAAQRLILTCVTGESLDADVWGHQLADALGIGEWGDECEHAPVLLQWVNTVERSEPVSHADAVSALKQALQANELALPAPLDTSLVAEPQPATVAAADTYHSDALYEAAEFGTLVHAALEQHARMGRVEFGLLDIRDKKDEKRLSAQVDAALDAMAGLPECKRTIPEFGVITPEGPRYIDLLRDLGGGRYQIIDYKSDRVTGDTTNHAEQRHGDQLRAYGEALRRLLEAREAEFRDIELFVCFTAPEIKTNRLIKITP
jgi:ATP-dependent helicase/nuclease subunit A